MKAAIILGTVIAILAGAQASAGGKLCRHAAEPCRGTPPISGASVSVLESDACWRGCTAQCGGQFQVCRQYERLSHCVLYNDACDRACLRQCRTSGGPFLNIFD